MGDDSIPIIKKVRDAHVSIGVTTLIGLVLGLGGVNASARLETRHDRADAKLEKMEAELGGIRAEFVSLKLEVAKLKDEDLGRRVRELERTLDSLVDWKRRAEGKEK